MKRAVITGGAGFIGSNLTRLLIESGNWTPIVVDNLSYSGHLTSLPNGTGGFEFVNADICDGSAIRRTLAEFQPSVVIHLAAESHVDRSIDSPQAFVETNIVGTFQLLQETLRYWRESTGDIQQEFRFVHVSTDEVYGSLTEGASPSEEEAALFPRSPYSASKASADHLAYAWHHTYGLPVIITRGSNNYGPRQLPEKLVPMIILRALQGRPLPIYGTGEQQRDWMYVLDHCQGLTFVLERGKSGETYHLGCEQRITNLELVHMLCRILDLRQPRKDGASYAAQISHVADRPGHDARYALRPSSWLKKVGWKPKVGAMEGLELTVDWYLANQSWWEPILANADLLTRQGINSR